MLQVFAESQDYGLHGERVRNACWGYLCQSGAMELKEASYIVQHSTWILVLKTGYFLLLLWMMIMSTSLNSLNVMNVSRHASFNFVSL